MGLKLLFAGTPTFAVPTLAALAQSNHSLLAVYTQPDRPAGRGRTLRASPVKQYAQQHSLPTEQPTSLKDPAQQQHLLTFEADLLVVVAYGLILPRPVLQAPRLGCINIHASLLPRWRGAAPIARALLAGDTETGVSIMQMDEGLDTGDVLTTTRCNILPADTTQTLEDRLATLGAQALLDALEGIEAGSLQSTPQDNTQTTYAQKLEKKDALLDWCQDAKTLDRAVRAFNPRPIAHTTHQDKPLRIWRAEALDETTDQSPGTLIRASKQGLDIATGRGILRLLTVQMPGGRALDIGELLNARANAFTPGIVLGAPPP